jgi:hypothetical protein
MKRFVKPFWNVAADGSVTRTTLGVESKARRYETGRGTLVTADDAKDARKIWARSFYPENEIQRVDTGKVIVFMAPPSW